MINSEYIKGLDDGHANESRSILNHISFCVKTKGWTEKEIVEYLTERGQKNVAIRKAHRLLREQQAERNCS